MFFGEKTCSKSNTSSAYIENIETFTPPTLFPEENEPPLAECVYPPNKEGVTWPSKSSQT